MLRFLQFWCKLNTREILKTCPFHFLVIIMVISSILCFRSFLTISYSFPWCFCMFPLMFLRFSRVFLLFPLSVCSVSDLRFCVIQQRIFFRETFLITITIPLHIYRYAWNDRLHLSSFFLQLLYLITFLLVLVILLMPSDCLEHHAISP